MTEHRVIVDTEADADDRLGYALAHIDGTMAAAVAELKRHIDATLETALLAHTERMAQDSDVAKPYWVSGSEHIGAHWWQRFSQRFTTAVLMAGLAVVLAVSTYLAAKLGVIK